MAEADLDAVIRQIAKAQYKTLMAAAKKRHAQLMARAGKARDKDGKARFKHLAKSTLSNASAAAKRLEISAQNAADSYARAMRKAMDEEPPAAKPAAKKKAANGT